MQLLFPHHEAHVLVLVRVRVVDYLPAVGYHEEVRKANIRPAREKKNTSKRYRTTALSEHLGFSYSEPSVLEVSHQPSEVARGDLLSPQPSVRRGGQGVGELELVGYGPEDQHL